MYGLQVTLTTLNTAYSMLTLLKAITSTIPPYCHQLIIQNDGGNTSTANIFVGSANLSTTIYGAKLPINGSINLAGDANSVQMDDIYLMADTSSTKVNVTILIQ